MGNRTTFAVLTSVVILTLIGCSGRSSTMPGPVAPLAAFALSAEPVLATSERVYGNRLNDGEYEFDVAELLDTTDVGANCDVKIEYALDYGVCSPDLYAWEPAKSEWLLWWRRDIRCYDNSTGLGKVLLSSSGLKVNAALLSPNGPIRIRSSDLGAVSARVLQLHSEYHTLPLPPNATAVAMAANDESLWISLRYYGTELTSDSVIVMDLAGEYLRSIAVDNYAIGMTSVPEGLWTMSGSQPIHFRLVNDDLMLLGEFTLQDNPDRYWAGIAWANDRLWMVDKYQERLVALDPAASLTSGTAVFTDSVGLDLSINPELPGFYPHTIAWNGEALCLAMDSVRGYDLSGSLQFALPSPSVFRDWKMAWDGEAMWAIHYGHGLAKGDKEILSRFTLE